VTHQDGGIDDIGSYSYDKKFQSVEKAESFIKNYLINPKVSIVKELHFGT
jgi:hypothetical protein